MRKVRPKNRPRPIWLIPKSLFRFVILVLLCFFFPSADVVSLQSFQSTISHSLHIAFSQVHHQIVQNAKHFYRHWLLLFKSKKMSVVTRQLTWLSSRKDQGSCITSPCNFSCVSHWFFYTHFTIKPRFTRWALWAQLAVLSIKCYSQMDFFSTTDCVYVNMDHWFYMDI